MGVNSTNHNYRRLIGELTPPPLGCCLTMQVCDIECEDIELSDGPIFNGTSSWTGLTTVDGVDYTVFIAWWGPLGSNEWRLLYTEEGEGSINMSRYPAANFKICPTNSTTWDDNKSFFTGWNSIYGSGFTLNIQGC
jgi:hypothetical protein